MTSVSSCLFINCCHEISCGPGTVRFGYKNCGLEGKIALKYLDSGKSMRDIFGDTKCFQKLFDVQLQNFA